MNKNLKIILFGLSLITLFCYTVGAAPSISVTSDTTPVDTFTDELPEVFSIDVNESSDIVWYLDGSSVQSSAVGQTSDSYSANPGSAGTYNVTVVATNSTTSESDSYTWDWNLYESLSIDSHDPPSDPTTDVGDAQTFSVGLNKVADVDWYIDDVLMATNSSVTSATYTNSTAPNGTYTVKATATNGTESKDQLWTWTVSSAAAPTSAPVVTLSDPASTSVSDSEGASRTFSATIDQTVDLTWILDGTTLTTNTSVTSASYSFDSVTAGTYNLTVYVENANGSDQKQWDWTVNPPSSNPPTASFDTNETEGSAPLTIQFNDTSSDADSWSWDFGDGETSTDQNPVHTYDSAGTYNVTLTATNTDGDDTANTTITVHPENYYSGDRIWDENAGQSTTYTWDAKSFSGFFYDLDSGISSESMTITNITRSIDEEDIVYETRPVETEFEQGDWGSYEVIGFMAEKYFAAYNDETLINGIETVSMMSNGQLSKVLIDNDDEESVFSGSALVLQEGYQLNIVEVDVNGDSVYVTLTKDGDELDSGVVSGGSEYIYETDLGDSDDVALIIVHFNEIFSGRESNAVFVEGVFQISEDYLELENGDSYGDMKITGIGPDSIEMQNDGTVSLSKGDTINLMGNIKLIVADSDVLRFAPFVDMSDPGTYELRGTVAEDQDEFTWTPLNFEGFYYDIDEGIMTETLKVTEKSGDTIQNLEYRSTPASVKFEHSQWGEFEVIGFMAEKYFAGYNDTTFVDDDVSLISSGQLAEVLLDTDDEVSVYSGSSLVLEEGYTLDILEVDTDGDSVLVELSKDGDEVDTSVVSSDDDYVYEVDVGDADDVPVIIIHFNEVFSGRESNAVFVEGIFQISEDYLELEDGDNYGEMEIDDFDDDYILMKNDGSISLGSGDEVSLMGEVGIKVADSGTLRYYPFVEVSTEPTGTLNVDLSETTVVEGTEITITVTSRGASVSDATIKVEDTTIGTTDEEGILEYTPSETGTLEIVAKKEGYTSGSDELEVISEDDESRKLVIEVSPDEVYEGTSATIFVLKAIGSEAVEGAEVTLDGNSIGSTSLDGTISYTMTEVGTHKLVATKSGFLDAELNLEVQELAANFEFSNLRITPLDVEEGEEATFSVDVTNTGTAAGEYTADLKVNGTVVDSQTVSLGMDESQTIEFKHTEEEPGVYTAEVGDLSEEYEVFESSGTIWYILGAIVLLVAGGVGYLFTAGGWTVEIAQAKVDEAIQSIQELIGNLR